MFSQRFRVLLRLKPSTLRSHTWEHPNVLVSEGFTEQQTRKIAVSLKDCAFSRMSAKNSDDKREHSLSHSHTSKRHGSTKYAADKETYLHMPKDEKRKVYKCGKDYITLDKIQRWPLYVQNRKGKYRNIGADKVQPKFEINDTLNQKVAIFRGDITKLEIDTIVNAANSSLAGGGGVDGAIHSAAGQKLLQTECKTLGGCKTGEAKITGGYKLPAKYVIHTVGPVGENEERLKSSYVSCLEIMKEKKLRTVAFPCISTGIYGYPNESACDTTLSTVRKWLEEGDNKDAIDLIIFCLFLPVDVGFYESKMLGYFPLPADIFGGDGDNGNNISTKDEKSKPQKPETPVDPSAAKAEVAESIGDVEMESQREEEEGSNTQPMASLDSEEECILNVDPPDSITDGSGSDLEVKQGEECLGNEGETPPVVKMNTATESELKERLQTEEGTDEGEQDFEEKAQARM